MPQYGSVSLPGSNLRGSTALGRRGGAGSSAWASVAARPRNRAAARDFMRILRSGPHRMPRGRRPRYIAPVTGRPFEKAARPVVAIHQPNYLPWLGWFAKAAQAEVL